MLRMRTLQEGSVGLFALFGLIIFGSIVVWLRGGILGQPTYQFFAHPRPRAPPPGGCGQNFGATTQ